MDHRKIFLMLCAWVPFMMHASEGPNITTLLRKREEGMHKSKALEKWMKLHGTAAGLRPSKYEVFPVGLLTGLSTVLACQKWVERFERYRLKYPIKQH